MRSRVRALAPAAALALLATLAPVAALAIDGSAMVTGGEVEFYGAAETNWLNGSELLIKFEGEGSFVLPGQSKARILAIGGGGGGGGVRSAAAAMTSPYGAGGGGGAGGFVEVTNVYSAATYSVVVGSRGLGGLSATTHTSPYYPGESGGNTTISTNGIEVITAWGGGGGGGETVGQPGGSGGGGSRYRSGSSSGQTRAGGAGTSGQGFAGGSGDVAVYGGGGGGAGGKGDDASTMNPVGGDGKSSDIACNDGEDAKWYAGGGGGGYSDKSFTGVHDPIAGGKGGGGAGGYGLNVACTDATEYGGGGGGSGALPTGSTTRGGSGYQGVVYVRVSVVAVGEIKKPESQAVVFDGEEHVLVAGCPAYVITDLTPGSPTEGKVVDSVAGTTNGTYKAHVKLIDGFKWSDGKDNEVTVTLTISKATPVISNLSIRDWFVGTPEEATPNPGCDVSISVTPTYSYGDSSTGPWVEEKPTTEGVHYLRAYIAGTDSYNEAEAITNFVIMAGPGDIFRDYVEIAIDGMVAESNNFVYALSLSEVELVDGVPLRPDLAAVNLVGFLYSRAGKTGEDLAFTDADGNILPYKVNYWDTTGESSLWVKLPTLLAAPKKTTIRMFWCLRDGKLAPEHSLAADESSGSPGRTFDLVVRDGKRVNYWTGEPEISKTKWDVTESAATVVSVGSLKESTSLLLYVTNLNTGAVYKNIDSIAGSFSAVFGPNDPAGNYEPISYEVDYCVVGHVTYGDLSGEFFGDEDALTRNGRVLLANDDSAPGGYSVKGQSYDQTDSSANTYWVHSEPHGVNHANYPYVLDYANHVLKASDGAGGEIELWKLENVMFGNLYYTTTVGSSVVPTLGTSRCALPASTTSKATSTDGLTEQGTLIMRNIIGAHILSPQYTNGVGTIYFDVVNGTIDRVSENGYRIKVEVSTDGGVSYEAKPMKPFKREDTAMFVPDLDQTDTTELTLGILSAGTSTNFYRVAVPVNCGGDVRFRIVRTSYISGYSVDSGFILLDNILVSYPKSTASLESHGSYDQSLTGRQVLGWGGAMSVPFPAVGEAVYASAKAVVDTNANAHMPVEMPISWAQMHYRWRYLDQQTNDWQTISLRPTDDFSSVHPMVIPSMEGDVEFWYDYVVQVPAYKYYDYTSLGLDLNGVDGKPLYSEEVTSSTNTQSAVVGHTQLPSGGKDWFFRLRRGRSDYESFTVYAKAGETGEVKEYPMTLSGNNLWRGLCATREEVSEGLYIRIVGRRYDENGHADYPIATNRFSLAGNAAKLPATDVLSPRSNDDSWEWFAVPCDAKTGYVLIQLQDDTRAYTVVHADYQDFNGWTDANKMDTQNGIFVGTSSDPNSTHMSGTTPEAVTYPSNFSNWNETIASNAYWTEVFYATKAELDAGLWPLYEPFERSLSPNTGFAVENGQWVNGFYRDNGQGMAFQMEGRGKGLVQFVNAAQSPRGLESVTFKARVAQAVEFNDFCYLMTDPTSKTNYTFATAASFDLNGRNDFAGNASLSLVALYVPTKGCYELRVEQENASVSAGIVSPGTKFRFSLYRWELDDEGEIVPVLLGSACDANTTGKDYFDTQNASSGYTTLFISVDASVDGETRVVGGVSKQVHTQSEGYFGSYDYREVMIRDTSDKRHKYGSYGLLSANCPAHFVQPSLGSSPVAFQGATTGEPKFDYGNYKLSPIPSSRYSCRNDIQADRWMIKSSRMVAVNTENANTYGINAVIPSTEVVVYTAPSGTVDWTPIATNTVSGFGSANSAGATTTIPLYSLDTCSVMIRAGGNARSARKDVTIDDIEFKQWRGESYDEENQGGVFDNVYYGSYTNIVFTQGWVKKGYDADKKPRTTCLLSAKRSKSSVATSIRSPRMVSTDGDERGLGLGNLAFSWENAQTNALLLVQIATNSTALSGYADLAKSVSASDWTTITNIDFFAMTAEERKEGSCRIYIGLHGVKGTMRIALDPARVAEIGNSASKDPTAFGEVTITGVSFRDEPMLDKYSWWGWNLRTTDDKAMRIISDNTADGTKTGLSLGLNNSVTADIRKDVPEEQYTKKFPFVQTPTFATDLVNEISFMARLYDTNDAAARITLYGANSGDLSDETRWAKLRSWDVTNTTYEAYTRKFVSKNSYMAFRLAVTGVDDVTERMPDSDPLYPPCRVLIDEVLVMEGVSAAVSFRNVGAFRIGLEETTAAQNVPSREQQPLCGEQWGVQCEVFPALLADEIDLSGARVRLWWFEGASPWGFENWKNSPYARSAWLKEATDTNLVFRSSIFGASDAVMKAQDRPCTVQYMLEVIYRAGGQPQTNWLSSAEWQTPSWYAPLDYNADRGGFSAYTILDTVSPGWAWINEVNIFGKFDDNYANTDKSLQFVEIAAPSTADLQGWKVRFLEAKMSGTPVRLTRVVTNDVAIFGEDLQSTKTKGMDVGSKMVFHVVGAPAADGVLDSDDGRFDGTWKIKNSTDVVRNGEIMMSYPLAVQLVRPSQIIESEIVAIGTNGLAYISSYNPEYAAELLSAQERGGNFTYVGMDSEGIPTSANPNNWSRSIGVFADNGSSPLQWNSTQLMTPGRINESQTITGTPPDPRGSTLLIYAFLEGGNITQTIGDYVNVSSNVMVLFQKDSPTGTNIVYRTEKWHEIGPVTVNGATVSPSATGNPREWTLTVGKECKDSVTVIASAQVDSSLARDYYVDPASRYRDAIVNWLMRGKRADGVTPFENPDATDLGLADHADKNGNVITNLTLTEMYWLDIDPTWGDHDIQLKVGWVVSPETKSSSGDLTSQIYMQITNRANGTAWAPNVLQGVELAKNSWAYADPAATWQWTGPTFKIKGLLPVNGLSLDVNTESNWVPQRWFVFAQNSFDAEYTSEIEMYDPFSPTSPSFNKAWYNWIQTHASSLPLCFRWDISDRSWPAAPEILKRANPCPSTSP